MPSPCHLSMGLLALVLPPRSPPSPAVLARARPTMATAGGPRRRPPQASLLAPLLEEGVATTLWSAAADEDFRAAKRAQAAKGAVQREATEAVMKAFFGGSEGGGLGEGGGGGGGGGGSRASVVLPGGAGKTVLALRVAEAMHARGALDVVLVLAPSLALVTQTVDEWQAWGGGAVGSRVLAVCSDADGADFTTSPDEVERFLAEAAAAAAPALMVGTYASAQRVAEALARSGGRLDLLVCDEAHRTTGATAKRDAQPLFDDALPARHRLFLTATPRLLGGDGEVASMDDAALYGPVVYRLPRGEAEARGLVVPLQLVFVNASEAYEEMGRRMPSLRVRLDEQAQSVSREHAEQAAPAHPRLTPHLLARVQTATLAARSSHPAAAVRLAPQVLAIWDCYRRHGTNTAFTFHSSNARAKGFEKAAASVLGAVASLEGDGAGFLTGRVHGGMPVSRRQQVLHPVGARDGRLKVISNCRVLGEGVDVPAVDLVAFIDAKSSHVDILQSMARASRVSPGKTRGLVLVMAGEGSLEVDVLRAFAEGDEELREAFYLMAREQARTGRQPRADELPPAVQRLWGGDAVELERVVGWLSTRVCDLAGSWERMHGLLLAFKAREGHCDVPRRHEEQGDKLGGWLGEQRKAYKRGTLEARRVVALEECGVRWSVL